jgi:hypothetical protein
MNRNSCWRRIVVIGLGIGAAALAVETASAQMPKGNPSTFRDLRKPTPRPPMGGVGGGIGGYQGGGIGGYQGGGIGGYQGGGGFQGGLGGTGSPPVQGPIPKPDLKHPAGCVGFWVLYTPKNGVASLNLWKDGSFTIDGPMFNTGGNTMVKGNWDVVGGHLYMATSDGLSVYYCDVDQSITGECRLMDRDPSHKGWIWAR